MTPANVRCLASYITPNVDIQATVIHFKPPFPGEILLEVPVQKPDCAIVVTVSTNSSHLDKYPTTLTVSLTCDDCPGDIRSIQSFYVFDAAEYDERPPCFPYFVHSADNPLVSEGTHAPATFKFTFVPWELFGYCETAQDEGYLNAGEFSNQLHPDYPWHLQFDSLSIEGRDVYINYISIELI